MNFLKGMFSDEADVDSHPLPAESQPLNGRNNNDASSSSAAVTAAPVAAESVSTTATDRLLLLEEQSRNDASPSPSMPGLTDGFQTWSQTFEAFSSGIFHTVLYFLGGIVGYSFLLDTKWPVIDSMYFSVVLFTTVGYGKVH
jgi:hypothetical protein